MSSRRTVLALAAFLVLASIQCVSAGFTMTMRIQPLQFHGTTEAKMSVELTNTGDEIAYNGQASLVFPDELDSEPLYFDVIKPDKPISKVLNVSLDPQAEPGVYPLIFMLQFHDNNNYPIYMIFESAMMVEERSVSMVFAEMSSAELPTDGSAKLTLKLKNADDIPHNVDVRVVVPHSLSLDDDLREVEVEPRSEKEVEYTVSNFMALPGDFGVLAVIDYVEDGVYKSTLTKGRVVVKKNESSNSHIILAVALSLSVIGAYSYFKLRK
ncbi:MAG: hypothetical protein GF416_05930 [Candidatus Altiarchaeales archaeon]|nr:hypothetical protein [Candidatus Altiarchaeales archaeon]MBD3416654.1 hypothetical protein [Candidatus Altiarchaeales archaeon]